MIPSLQLPRLRSPGSGIIGEGGFPHSEICGSKVAHTSPQLIAACHVLHRLCMPRHPRIALTSRLRIHTISDKPGTRVADGAGRLHKAPVAAPPRRSHSFTQLDKDYCEGMPLPPGRRTARSKETMPPRHRFLEPIHNVKVGGRSPCPRASPRSSGLHLWKQLVEPAGIEPATSSLQS